jgi:hypothetical protein
LLNPLEKKKEWGTQIATTCYNIQKVFMCEEKAMPLTTRLNEKCRAKPSKVGGHF